MADNIFFSRLDDMVRKAESGRITASSFLTPEEQQLAKKHLEYCAPTTQYAFFGGYPEAERKILVLFPDFADESFVDTGEYFRAIIIDNGGYSEITHSACLGAIMNLSVERSSIGDICVISKDRALIFVKNEIARFLMSSEGLVRVGREKVRLSEASQNDIELIKREYEEISVTVASTRVDCLVSEISCTSREKAKSAVLDGAVSKNHIKIFDPSEHFECGDTVSVKGKGKYTVTRTETTRKGRVRVTMLKYK